jgi:endonuclease/exonuclease/phosphatase (EEP) superfamily protein YafD
LRRLLDEPPFTAVGLLWRGPPLPVGAVRAGGGRRFRLVATNALKKNRRPEAWAASVLDLAPDVLCVAELTATNAAALAADGRRPRHACVEVHPDSGGTGLFARWPLEDARVLDTAGHALPVARVAELGVTVGAVHPVAPSNRSKGPRWRASYETIEKLVAEVDGPLVLAGDWNATGAHSPLRDLVAGGVVGDAHTAAGRGSAATWPARCPVALLDRVLVSTHVAVVSIAEHRAPGSDHLAVVADLELAP